MIDDHHAAALRLGPGVACHFAGSADLWPLDVDGNTAAPIEAIRARGGAAGFVAMSIYAPAAATTGHLGWACCTVAHAGNVRATFIDDDGSHHPLHQFITPEPLTLALLMRAGLN